MTDDQRITELAKRVDSLENDLWSELKAVRKEQTDEFRSLHEKLTNLSINQVKNFCPAPGKCLHLDTALGSAVLRIERLELAILDMDRWRNRVVGGMALLVVALTLFGPIIRKLLKLE